MNWFAKWLPWSTPEGDVTAMAIAARQAAAAGQLSAPADPASCSVVLSIAGLMARVFASAEVSGAGTADISPSFLGLAGRLCILRGELFARVIVDDTVRFEIADVEKVLSNGYRLRLPNPDPEEEDTLFTDTDPLRVLFNAVSVFRGAPAWAGPAASALANLEASVAQEGEIPNARIFVRGIGGNAMEANESAGDWDVELNRIARQGGLQAIQGEEPSPVRYLDNQFKPTATGVEAMGKRLGYEGSNPLPQVLMELKSAVAIACGVSPALVYSQQSGSQTLQAAYRHFLSTLAEPSLALLEAELQRLIGAGLKLSLPKLVTPDIAGRARAVASLIAAGIERQDALMLAGLD